MNYKLFGRTLLILGGTAQQKKIIEAAREIGVRTIVTDYLDDSPAKILADKKYNIDINDIDGLADLCLKEQVDGVITCYIDPCQRPYFELCERMGYHCYGTKQQFQILTDKHCFKKFCIENGIDVIPEYKEDQLDTVIYPVFVKPVDSRGSRGQRICSNEKELIEAISAAKIESSNGDVIIEKFMENSPEVQVTYFFVNGEAHLLRICDTYCGTKDNHMEKVASCSVSPSRFTNYYIDEYNDKIVEFLKKIGIKNGPVFMQGFYDAGVFRFFDPGFRLPGVDYERILKKVYGFDLMINLVSFALCGSCGKIDIPKDVVYLKGKRTAILFPTIKSGIIDNIIGAEKILSFEGVVSYISRYSKGDKIGWTYNVNQRLAEIDCISDNTEILKKLLSDIQKEYYAIDADGANMIYDLFDVNRIV